jgi:hypothetical protein
VRGVHLDLLQLLALLQAETIATINGDPAQVREPTHSQPAGKDFL